jgi:dihydroorotate dehydrogenase
MRLPKILNPWKLLDRYFDPYPLIRPFLFLLDPEDAHEITLKMLECGMGPQFFGPDDAILSTKVFGVDFPNPIQLGAGLDKQAGHMDAFMGFGFGSIEIGTVTPLPQAGNPRPRMFRIPQAKALINRFGFNSVGVDMFAQRLKDWRALPERTHNPIGVNIGKNKDTVIEADDYLSCFEKIATLSDYVTINVSSPNTPGLRDLQGREKMAALVKTITDARDRLAPQLPVLVKIAPDLTEEQLADIAAVLRESAAQGVIVTNTTLARPSSIPEDLAKEAGGLSGPPLFGPSTRLLSQMYKALDGKMPIIGCGGVSTGLEAYEKIRAGASLVQVYTALVFEGPLVIQKMKRELAELLRRDGFTSVADAVGADHR